MRKTFIIFYLFIMSSLTCHAQLKVSANGKVGVGTTSTPVSTLAVGCAGDTNAKAMITSDRIALKINSQGNMPNGQWGTGLLVTGAISSTSGDVGVESNLVRSTPVSSGRAIGVLGSAGNAQHGKNFGVVGSLQGVNDGAAIVGVVGSGKNLDLPDRYAGFFDGNVYVTGVINGTLVSNSDSRYKESVEEMDTVGILTQIGRLAPVTYKYKTADFFIDKDSLSSSTDSKGSVRPTALADTRRHYGLIAQDVQRIYPDLVYEDKEGYLSVNYTELIPLLIQSVKSLDEKVRHLSALCRQYEYKEAPSHNSFGNGRSISSAMEGAVLYQNTPNPFTSQTTISYQLPEGVADASIFIFNMQGLLVEQIPVSGQQGSVTVDGSGLAQGMYLYSLIVGGVEIDTKRMIFSR